ncbi:MAG: cysteine synthase A [Bacteroidaceae bacterium]|nr:cysteine synthase A [Bacteroidaceae bacterium]
MIYQNLTELIGNTPLLEIKDLGHHKARLLLKLELFNPGGSVKDRVALSMIEDAEAKGILKPGATIIEPTSGNTGVGLAWIGKVKGYRVILTMPESMSLERRNLLKAYGAELELTPASEGMSGAIRRAEELKNEIPGAVILGQFVNPANPAAHERTTGEEIWKDTEGKVDIFIAGAGTGGTISGVGRCLKAHNPEVKVIAVEPLNSPVLSGGKSGKHKIQGIGAGFIPETYDGSVVDEVRTVSDSAAIEAAVFLAKEKGLLVGISSGAAFYEAYEQCKLPMNAGKTIVVLLPDTGERYLSTGIFG